MSEHIETPEASESANAAKKPFPQWALWAILIGAGAVLFVIQGWFLTAKASGIREKTFQNAVAAMSVSLQRSLLTRNTDAIRPVITGMADAASYSLIVVTDPAGVVVASTDRTLDASTVQDMKNPPVGPPRMLQTERGLQATAPIALGGNNVIGTLRVVMPDQP